LPLDASAGGGNFIYCEITAWGIIILVKNEIMPYLFDDATNKFLTALDEILPLSDESKRRAWTSPRLLAVEPDKRLEFMRKIDPDLVRRVPEEYMRSYLGL
jgi:hypothetical protein